MSHESNAIITPQNSLSREISDTENWGFFFTSVENAQH